jgi:nitric oxide dioxygenase
MLNHLVDTDSQRRVDILHADRTPAALAHRSELMDLVSRLPRARAIRWYEDPGQRTAEHGVLRGRVDLDQVSIAPDVRAYLCGQLPFMTGVRDALIARRVPRERIHYEVFGPEDRSRRAS